MSVTFIRISFNIYYIKLCDDISRVELSLSLSMKKFPYGLCQNGMSGERFTILLAMNDVQRAIKMLEHIQ
jgi:hypothetical protein